MNQLELQFVCIYHLHLNLTISKIQVSSVKGSLTAWQYFVDFAAEVFSISIVT